MYTFEYNGNPSRVIFGNGTIQKLPEELTRQNLHAPLVLSTPEQAEQADRVKQILLKSATNDKDENKKNEPSCAGVFTEAAMHTPTHITDRAVQAAQDTKADSIVSIGGGSTTGLGKAISIRTGLPHISIPTTYAGSEMTPILGETADGIKKTRRDPKILPGTVIYDVELTMTLPTGLSATSGVNAIAHAVEALYARDSNPIIKLLAKEGIQALTTSLPVIVTSPSDIPARNKALYGAWLCGICLGSVEMALHHKLCHTLGGSFNLPHAETHTIILSHALAYNLPAMSPPEAVRDLAAALRLPDTDTDSGKGDEDPTRCLNVLLKRLGVKRALKDLGMKEEDVAKAADIALKNPYWNPRPVEHDAIQDLIRRAWAGEDARPDL